jgi:hypothetical protein
MAVSLTERERGLWDANALRDPIGAADLRTYFVLNKYALPIIGPQSDHVCIRAND